MGVTAGLGRLASRSLHVLIVECPGEFGLRAAAERACLNRGWQLALSPADTDALLVCGPASSALADAIKTVWRQVPGPRVRAEVTSRDELETSLDRLVVSWSRGRPDQDLVPDLDGGPDEHEHMGGRHDMSVDGMEMSGPGGVALASGSEDRDGLEMDQLQVRLGPVLPCWPVGLSVWCTLQGDLVTEVEVEESNADAPNGDPPAALGAYRLDAASQLLRLAGAVDVADAIRAVRDALLADPSGSSPAIVASWRRRLERARVLRWSLRGLGVVERRDIVEQGWPVAWAGDVYDRLLRLLDPFPETSVPVGVGEVADALPVLLPGRELASARLMVASLVAQRNTGALGDLADSVAR